MNDIIQEQWTQWKPIQNLSKKYYVQSISDTFSGGLKIKLINDQNPQKKVLISWSNSVDAYRKTYETFAYLTLNNLDEKYGKEFRDWTFFKIENSAYLKWLSMQSYGITDSLNFTHFCIYSTEEMVDVITSYEPNVTAIDENE